jgi:hypothetical protein
VRTLLAFICAWGLFACAPAVAQSISSLPYIDLTRSYTWTGTTNSFTGNVYVAGQLGSASNTLAPSAANSGITIGGSPTWAMASLYDAGASANNRTADILLISNTFKLRFANDARSAFTDFYVVSGGQSGITGITSTSGSGAWAHTGAFSASGLLTASAGVKLPVTTVAALPTCNAGNEGLKYAVSDFGGTLAYNGAVAGGGSTHLPVYCNGTAWTQH